MKRHSHFTPLYLFILITLICAVIFVPYFLTGKAFILGWDMRTIYSSNFENLRTMVDNWRNTGTLPYWSWVNFLGNDFYSSKLFYFNDFWEYIFVFTNLPYSEAIVYMTYLRFLTAGFCFYAYARYNKHSDYTCILGSLLFAFSAYLLQIMRDPFFASFITFLPLYFLAVDRYICEKKTYFYVFMVFFMFLNSYYLFYMTSLFTILYFIWRWQKEYGNYKNMMKQAIRLIGYYIIGFMISGIIVIPEIVNVLNNSRVGTRSAVLIYESILPYLEYLSGIFTPTSIVAYRGDAISQLYLYDTPNHQLMAVYLWAGSVCAILFPQSFANKGTRKISIVNTVIISCITCVPILSSIMHGFSEPSFRWMANVTFLLIAAVLPFLEHPESINKPLLIISFILIACLLVGTPLLFNLLLKAGDIREGYQYLLYCVPFVLINGMALTKNWKPLLLIGTVAELGVVCFCSFFGNEPMSAISKTDFDRLGTIMGNKNYYNEWTLTLDPENEHSFYRSYIDPDAVYFGRGTNYNLDANIRGLMAYDSTYLASTNDLILLDEEQVVDYLPWTFNIKNADIMTLVSTKYAIVGKDQECPFKNGELIGHYADSWDVYLNQDYINLGKTYTDVMTYEDYTISQSDRITKTIICHSEDYDEIRNLIGKEEVSCYSAHAEGNHVSAGILTSEEGFAVLSVPFDKGWSITVNGTQVKTYCVNGGMTGIPLEAGENDIQMWFTPQGLKTGKYCSAAGIMIWLVLVISNLILRKKEKK